MVDLTFNHVLWVLLTAMGCGALVGAEREWTRHDAGLRTNALVAFGAALFTLLSIHGFPGPSSDPARIAAQIVTGIGFLGAGVIMQRHHRVQGLTTAATVWAAAALGLTAGTGAIQLAWLCAGLIVCMQLVLRVVENQISAITTVDQTRMKLWALTLEYPNAHEARLSQVLAMIDGSDDATLLDAWAELGPQTSRMTLVIESRKERTIRSLQAGMLLAGFVTVESVAYENGRNGVSVRDSKLRGTTAAKTAPV